MLRHVIINHFNFSRITQSSQVDFPRAPNDAGFSEFVHEINDDFTQKVRTRLFNVQKSDLFDVAER